jgi:D-erythrulose 1-phosphate 3-epimerase
MVFPRVYLAIDNCFASKRWTRPREWLELVRELGLGYVEASADTEADPLYCGEPYMEDWARDVARNEKATGVKVVNLYSGHGTYTTLGLGHTDARVRQRMLDQWITPMIRLAARLDAGLGFFCHAFPISALQGPDEYRGAIENLYGQLSQVARFASEQGVTSVGVEQMYSPHQWPWTIAGGKDLVRRVSEKGAPLYLTLDTGHQTGQRRFLRPGPRAIRDAASGATGADAEGGMWLGPESLNAFFEARRARREGISGEDLAFVEREMDRFPSIFSAPEDGDTYSWLESLGCYAPIVHLQQVTGSSSAHQAFTASANAKGIIHPEKVLGALRRSFLQPPEKDLPKRVESIYLTLEIFAGTAERPSEIVGKIRESVAYWRQFIRQDGARLDELPAAGA